MGYCICKKEKHNQTGHELELTDVVIWYGAVLLILCIVAYWSAEVVLGFCFLWLLYMLLASIARMVVGHSFRCSVYWAFMLIPRIGQYF